MRHHPLPDHRRLHLAEFEDQRRCDVMLFALGLADEELPGLAVVIRKTLGAQPALGAALNVRKRREPALGGLARPFPEGVRLVIDATDRIAHGHVAVLLEMA